MSWMRLLAVGRSIKPMGVHPGRYRLSAPIGVPKFGGGRSVRLPSAEPKAAPSRERAPESAITPAARAAVRPAAFPAARQSVGFITPQRKVAQAPAKVGRAFRMTAFFKKLFFGKDPKMNSLDAGARVAPAATFDVPAQAYPLGRWTLFKNPFAKRSKPVEPVAPVQGELLLDMVKPIRNDLIDSDLEVVVPGLKAGKGARGAAAPAASGLVSTSAAPSAASSVPVLVSAPAPDQAPVSERLGSRGELGALGARAGLVAVEPDAVPASMGSERAEGLVGSTAWGRASDEFFRVSQS